MSLLRIFLRGVPRIESDGRPVSITSRKAFALLGILALARRNEAARVALQHRLWGSHGAKQAQASLRRELSNLRAALGEEHRDLLVADHRTVRLDCHACWIDVVHDRGGDSGGEFLEGIDLRGEDDFEDWLRHARSSLFEEGVSRASDEGRLHFGLHVLPVDEPHGRALPAFVHDAYSTLVMMLGRQQLLPIAYGAGAGERSRYALQPRHQARGSGSVLQLVCIDKKDQRLVWSDQLVLEDRPNDGRIGAVANSLPYILDQEEARRGSRDFDGQLCEARTALRAFSEAGIDRARLIVETLRAQAPRHDELLILSFQLELTRLWHFARENSADEARELCKRSDELATVDPRDCRLPALSGTAHLLAGDLETARTLFERSIALNPCYALAHAFYGAVLAAQGDTIRGLWALDQAIELAVHDPFRWLYVEERDAIAHRTRRNPGRPRLLPLALAA